MVVTLKGHNWPTFKASGPKLLTVTEISSWVVCHVQPSAKKGDWTLRTDGTEKGTSTEVAAQELLVLEKPSNADACDFRTRWFARLESRCQEISKLLCDFSSNISSLAPAYPQLLTCFWITVVRKILAAHNSAILNSMLISCSCWIAGFLNNYYQLCILLNDFQCKKNPYIVQQHNETPTCGF